MRRMDYFELLGLPPDAPADSVRSAAVELLREYRVEGTSGSSEVQGLVQQIADLVGKAHDTLIDPAARARYRDELRDGGVKHEVGAAVGRMLEAESAFRRGEQLLVAGKLPGAHAAFREAVELQPEEGEFLALLGWTTHAQAPGDADASQRALTSSPARWSAAPPWTVPTSTRATSTRRWDKAQALGEYEKAVECNPACTEALRELSILNWAARLGQTAVR